MTRNIIHWIENPKRQFGFLVVVAFAFLMAVGSLVGPLLTRLQLEAELENTRSRRQQQEVLFPFYRQLLSSDRKADWQDLHPGTLVPLRQSQVVDVPSMLARITEQHGYRPHGRADYRINKDSEGNPFLQVELPLQGRYDALGALLADFLRENYVARIVSLGMHELATGRVVVIVMHLLLES